MKIKKIIFLAIITLMTCSNVYAKTITCDYGERKILFYTENYSMTDYSHYFDSYDSNGNQTSEQISNIKEIRPMDVDDCPKKIEISRDSLIFSNDSNSSGYELVVANDGSKVSCGTITDIPKKFPELTSMFMTIIQIAVPVVLVIFGMLDLFKGIMASKEDEIKKGQQIFIKRLIVAAMIFFVFVIVKFLISLVADTTVESNNIVECMNCFLNGVKHCK